MLTEKTPRVPVWKRFRVELKVFASSPYTRLVIQQANQNFLVLTPKDARTLARLLHKAALEADKQDVLGALVRVERIKK